MTKKELLEKRAEAAGAIKELRALIDAEKREMTTEENTNFDKAGDDYDRYSVELDLIERTEQIDRDMDSFDEDRDKGPSGDIDEETRLLAFQGASNLEERTEAQTKAMERMSAPFFNRAGNAEVRLARRIPTTEAEWRAWETGTDNKGGYTVPTTLVRTLEKARIEFGPMLSFIRTIRTSGGEAMHFATANDTAEEGEWKDEEASVTEDTSDPFGELILNAYKWDSKVILISQELIEDSAFDMVVEVGEMIGERRGRALMTRCTTGTGSGQHNGIVTAATAVDSNSATAVTIDDPIDLEYAVDPAYRARGKYMAHSTIFKAFRKLKDSDGRPLWEPSIKSGEPATLNGYPIIFNNKMSSTISEDEDILLFGNLKKYILREVAKFRLYRMNEHYRGTDQTGFVAFMRSDSDLLDAGTHPVKVLNVIAAGS